VCLSQDESAIQFINELYSMDFTHIKHLSIEDIAGPSLCVVLLHSELEELDFGDLQVTNAMLARLGQIKFPKLQILRGFPLDMILEHETLLDSTSCLLDMYDNRFPAIQTLEIKSPPFDFGVLAGARWQRILKLFSHIQLFVLNLIKPGAIDSLPVWQELFENGYQSASDDFLFVQPERTIIKIGSDELESVIGFFTARDAQLLSGKVIDIQPTKLVNVGGSPVMSGTLTEEEWCALPVSQYATMMDNKFFRLTCDW